MKEIRNIIGQYDQVDWSKEKAALATVVSVEQSSYRRIGARLFVRSNGEWTGGISGGCLEGDALRRAQTAIYKNEPSVVTYDTLDEDDHQIGIGLGCNGKVEVLFVPVDPYDPTNPVEVLRAQLHTREPRILMQVISGEGINGMLYTTDQLQQLEQDFGLPVAALGSAIPEVVREKRSNVSRFTSWENKSYELLFEWLRPEMRLIIVGDNYDVSALAGIVYELGWEMHLVGTLRKFNKSIYDLSSSVRHYDEVDELVLDPYTCVLLMSHDYQRDLRMVRHFLPLEPAYLGMLGPRKRTQKMQGELRSEGLDLVGYPGLYSPIGLDIGAESPEEIALAIISEVVSVFRGREGKSLRLREGSIH